MELRQEQKQQSFLYATLVLGASTLIVKILGAIFRIPLANLIGSVGMGYFSTAYDVYLPIYALAMAGLPVAVSRLVAECVAGKKFKDARRTLRVVKRAFLVTGLVGFVLMFAVAFIVVAVAKNPQALPAMFMIAPSIFFCCMMSAYRGYYEGIRNMFPTAISSLIEAVCKLLLGYGFAWLVLKNMKGSAETVASYAAAAAMLGITLGTVFAAAYLIFRHKKTGDQFTKTELAESPAPAGGKAILKALIAIAIPVALGSLVNNIASLIDVAMVQRQLSNAVAGAPGVFRSAYGAYLVDSNGAVLSDAQIPNFLYGCYKGYAYTIFNFVPTITSVIGVSALPVLTMAWTSRKKKAIKENIESMLKVITLIAFPAGIGVMALAPQIVHLLYRSADADIAARLLSVLGAAACLAGMTTPLTNMLQAIGRPMVPVKNIAMGACIKIVVNFILVGTPQINIMGAPIGTLLCYLYIAIADIFCLIKYSRVVPSLYTTIIKPLIAAAFCGVSAYLTNLLLSTVIGNTKLVTLVAILVAVMVYVIAISAFRCISRDDVVTLPKGEKIADIFVKLHIIR